MDTIESVIELVPGKDRKYKLTVFRDTYYGYPEETNYYATLTDVPSGGFTLSNADGLIVDTDLRFTALIVAAEEDYQQGQEDFVD